MKQQFELEQEFSDIVNRNSGILFKVCWMFFSGNNYQFQELRQEILLALWKEYKQYGRSRFGSVSETNWTYTIAWRAALVYCRNLSREKEIISLDSEMLDQIPASDNNEIIDALREFISNLNDNDRRWVSYYLDQYSYDTISELEGLSKVSARKRMSRMIQKLRMLSKYYK